MSKGQASGVDGITARQFSLELATSSHPPDFPLVPIGAALNGLDSALQFIGLEKLAAGEAWHVRTHAPGPPARVRAAGSRSPRPPRAQHSARTGPSSRAARLPQELSDVSLPRNGIPGRPEAP